jgi:hypothetical protein
MNDKITPPRRPGRPKKINALTEAERSKLYRDRKKARFEEIRDESKPLHSPIIDLSALPAWKRRR